MMQRDYVIPPCTEDPELFYDEEFPVEEMEREMWEDTSYTEEDRLVMARWARDRRERQLKAQLVCLTMCPLPQRAMCQEIGLQEEEGIWAGQLPEERAKLRAGEQLSYRKPRSKLGRVRSQMATELLSGLSIAEIAEMHGTTRKTVLSQLTEQVIALSAPSANMQVA